MTQAVLVSCTSPETATIITASITPVPTDTIPAIPSETPFVPDLSTPTPSILHLWLSPALPESLSEPILGVTTLNGRPIEFVSDPNSADVRVEAWPDVPLTEWVFALVTAFPTIIDGITMDELREIWVGGRQETISLHLKEQVADSLSATFGYQEPSSTNIQSDEILADQLWEEAGAISIVPFEALEPRYKVLALEGQSPIRKDFDLESYPLKVPLGLSGEPESVGFLMDAITWPASNRDPDQLTILLMTGVTALTRATAWTMETKGLEYPAEKINDWLLEADLTHISNEVSFMETCPAPSPVREGLIFCSDPDYVQLLQAIDVDIIELTGNHLKDHGEESLTQTLKIYEENEWGIFGGGANLEAAFQPLLIQHNGNKLAFLGCNSAGPGSVWAKEKEPGATPCDFEQLHATLEGLKSEGYLTVFTFQWNEYYRATPTTEQMEEFRAAIDAGAVIVNGSQAHQPQAMEFYGDGFIHYGLGNLFFDQMWAIKVRQEFLDRHVFYAGKHISTELLTAFLEDFAQPRPMNEDERTFFLQEIFEASGW